MLVRVLRQRTLQRSLRPRVLRRISSLDPTIPLWLMMSL